jgi:hypothetical protein
MDVDLGDVVASFNIRIKGRRHFRLVWRIGAVTGTGPDDRIVKPPPYAAKTGRRDAIMDLMADKQVALSVEFTDEVGNPVSTPDGAVATFTVDDPTIINLTDNGDGTAAAAAVGPLGTATVHVVSTLDGEELTGDLAIVVVSGLAERISIVPGEITEVTEDPEA